jgi:RNA polymerase sigma-70 factor (ECF subfamily)
VEGADWIHRDSAKAELGTIYREHVRYVWRCVRHLGVREADVEDLTQEVFLVIGRKLSTFEGRSSLKTWIYGITLRVVSDHRRKAHSRREVSVAEPSEAPADDNPQEEASRRGLRLRLQRHLDALSAAQREVFVLYELEELTMKEVADVVGVPLQTAYSRLHAARECLKARLSAAGDAP